MELFEIIRRDHHVKELSIRALARKHCVHRRLVRLALKSAVPPERKRAVRRSPVFTPALKRVVDAILKDDQTAPRKQRHTSRRIFIRLVQEHDFVGAESTVRKYVAFRRRELGRCEDVFVPQSPVAGQEAEVDWFEAYVDFPQGRTKVFFFQMRSCFSGRIFVAAFPRQTQQAFLEAHALAFQWFGGVFPRIRYDNLTAAVRKVLQGRRRLETDRFVAMRSHYLFESIFCRPGLIGAHEKGGVEGGCGRFRRHHLTPVPTFQGFEELNTAMRDACARDDLRVPIGATCSIEASWNQEHPALLALPEPFDTARVSTPRVSRKGGIRVACNTYSVPVRYVGRKVEARLTARRLEVRHEGKVVALHSRLHGKGEQRLVLDHYLDVLQHKPGAFRGATALRQARERGEWPAVYDALWAAFQVRTSPTDAARDMTHVLMLHRTLDPVVVHQAVATAVELGCVDADAVALLARQLVAPKQAEPLESLGDLDAHGEAASADMSMYDTRLLRQEVA